MPEPDLNKIASFATSAELGQWLRRHHATETELWVKIFKKPSGKPSVDWNEVVIESLCWGWIDGIKKPLDAEAYLQRITPRKARSGWSQRNRAHVERLIKAKRMQPPGLEQVRAAQADGRWDNAYAPASEMQPPADFLAALELRPQAKQFFATLNRANVYAFCYRIETAKKPETRQRRINQFVQMLERGEKLH